MGKFRVPAPAPAPGKTRLQSTPAPGSSCGFLFGAIYKFFPVRNLTKEKKKMIATKPV